jgi:hypothetical protein
VRHRIASSARGDEATEPDGEHAERRGFAGGRRAGSPGKAGQPLLIRFVTELALAGRDDDGCGLLEHGGSICLPGPHCRDLSLMSKAASLVEGAGASRLLVISSAVGS